MTKGFTLIEVLAAMFIMVMGVLGVFGLITRTVTFNSSVNSQLVASYLAQEGLELVRNIRDANFLKIHKGAGGQWNDGLTSCAAGCGADYNDTVLGSLQDTLLKLNNGFYAYDAGTDTIFTRKITIDPATIDVLKVSVDVSWQDKGNTRTVRGATELYNWLAPAP
jgi:type IV pilus modification protein PilV